MTAFARVGAASHLLALLLVAALIKLDSPGPVFYVQERMGLDGRPFLMFKFRSMQRGADANGAAWTVKNDPRRTRLGSLIRRLPIDELPNFTRVETHGATSDEVWVHATVNPASPEVFSFQNERD